MDQLSANQVAEWEAFDKLDPIGKWRDEYGFASVIAQMTNLITWAHAKKGTKHVAADFLPDWDVNAPKEEVMQTIEDMKKVFEEIAKVQNTKVGIQPTKPPKQKKQ